MNAGTGTSYRVTVDTGGTFTDAVISDGSHIVSVGKAPTTYGRLADGLHGAVADAAERIGLPVSELFAASDRLTFGTTHAVNALVQGRTAKTALLVTEGFPDILLFREGGRSDDLLFEYDVEYPDPFIPRQHTFQVRERIDAEGGVETPLDEEHLLSVLRQIRDRGYEAVAVCLVWSVANPDHERRIAHLLEQEVPGVPYSLSHEVLPIIREYRRASATSIDAALKPLVQSSFRELVEDLRTWGYQGPILVSTSNGGCVPIQHAIERPALLLKSGPAMAPVAGRAYAEMEALGGDVIVADTGGTTFDVGLIRAGDIMFTRETWLGGLGTGELLAMSSVEINSIGSGGGSIAEVDSGGMLNVGPRSAGSEPGPACYGRGGTEPTVSDAAVVLGYLLPDHFFGGRLELDVEAAHRAVGTIGDALGMTPQAAAHGILRLANETMIDSIHGLTLRVGLDPRDNVLVAGGGAAGLNIVAIARELGIEKVLIPSTAGAFSAAGMQFAELVFEASASRMTRSDDFDDATIVKVLAELDSQLDTFVERSRGEAPASSWTKEFLCEARYAGQVWDVEFRLPDFVVGESVPKGLVAAAFHDAHERLFTFAQRTDQIEYVNWIGRVKGALAAPMPVALKQGDQASCAPIDTRVAWFEGVEHKTPIFDEESLLPGNEIEGPAIVVSPTSTLVLYPSSTAAVTPGGNLLVTNHAF